MFGWPLEEMIRPIGKQRILSSSIMVGYTLTMAINAQREDLVILLLDQGADINAMSSMYGSALASAAFRGSRRMVSLLLDRGANINATDGKYVTPLTAAVLGEKEDMVILLLDRGADINTMSGVYGAALASAVFIWSQRIVSLLLDRGANINAADGEFVTPLTTAVLGGMEDMVALLLDREADINVMSGEYGTALASAAFIGSRKIVELLLNRGANINAAGGKYVTPLTAAVLGEKGDMVTQLLDWGADINAMSGEYGTALALAAFRGGWSIVLLLLGRRANINAADDEYRTPLTAAVLGEKEGMVALLLDRGANINAMSGQYGTALASAAFRGSRRIVELLLDRGANINAADGEFVTPLTAAVLGEKEDMVALLLDRGADIDAMSGEYGAALALAAFIGSRSIVLLLLDGGANINAADGEYRTPLTAAVLGEKEGMVALLLDKEADINAGMALSEAILVGNEDIVALLLDRGADKNVVREEYGTALAVAVFTGRTTIVSLLLSRGANINMRGGKYGTALCVAVTNGSKGIVRLLLSRAADINLVGGEYGTALIVAVHCGRKDIVELLLDQGADVNTSGGKYGTALIAAVYHRRKDIVELLLTWRADTNGVGSEYATALGGAVFAGSTDIVSLLLEHGADVMRVGGCCSTPSGVYPSALDVAHSEGSQADPTLRALLKTAIRKPNPDADRVMDVISRPPFPMPYTVPYSTLYPRYYRRTLPLDLISFDIRATKFRAGDSITSKQADILCEKIKKEDLWHSLATLVGLNEDTIKAKHQWIRNDVSYFVSCGYDFGLAYAAARVAWKDFNKPEADYTAISIHRGRWHRHAQLLDEARSEAIKIQHSSSRRIRTELIIKPYLIMPRRLWDLKSNRVVDFRMIHASQLNIETKPHFWAVSHSWTSDMSPQWTVINQRKWPVPLPKDITLDDLRSELLTLGAEYVWLDVICLRQQSGVDSLDRLKREEWRLDVPTIGNIYREAKNIVRYFNGLGVRFNHNGWDNPRHWLQRAWTLQEIATETTAINGGVPRHEGQVFLNSQGELFGKVIKFRTALRPVIQLATEVDSAYGCEVYKLAREMTKRHASHPVDKLSGLFYLLRTTELPCYDEQMTSEDFWSQCFHLLPPRQKGEILFNFPYRGSEDQWFPTWSQMLDWPRRDPEYDHMRSERSPDSMKSIPGEASFFISNIWTLPHAILYTTNNPDEYKVEINKKLFGFYVPYLSQKPINVQGQSRFTLAIDELEHAYNWVVCRDMGKQTLRDFSVGEVNVLKKVGVIRTDFYSELRFGGEHGASLLQLMDCLFV